MASNDNDTIKSLLEKYMEGCTTLEEERRLKEYFASGNVDAEFSYAVPMFAFFGKAAAEKYKGGVKQRASLGKSRKLFYAAVSVAAAIAVVFGTYMIVGTKPQEQVYCYINGKPVTDIDIAVRQAEFAAGILNRGLEATGKGLETVEAVRKSAHSFDAALRALDKVNGIMSQSK